MKRKRKKMKERSRRSVRREGQAVWAVDMRRRMRQ